MSLGASSAHLAASPLAPEWLEPRGEQTSWTAEFEQERFSSLKKFPFRSEGRLDYSPEHGLWIHYPSDNRSILVTTDEVRVLEEGGTERDTDEEFGRSLQALLYLLDFQFESLAEDFTIEANGQPTEEWKIRVEPKDGEYDFASMTLNGTGTYPSFLEIDRGYRKRLDITLRPAQPMPETTGAQWLERGMNENEPSP